MCYFRELRNDGLDILLQINSHDVFAELSRVELNDMRTTPFLILPQMSNDNNCA